jgi:hypothetical protein
VIVVNATMAQTFVRTIEHQMTAGFARDLTVRPLGAALEVAARSFRGASRAPSPRCPRRASSRRCA